MTPAAGILLFLSAITHAGWNFLSKKDHPTLAYYLVANTIGALCILPLLFLYGSKIFLVPSRVWHCVNISGFCLAFYMAALAGAYRIGEISIAYPIARSLPAVLVTALAAFFGFGRAVGGTFWIGVLLIVAGCILLPLKDWRQLRPANYCNGCAALAISAAVFIAAYTLVDYQALEWLRASGSEPFSAIDATIIYMVLEAFSASLWKAVLVMGSQRERAALREVLAGFKGSAAVTGFGIYLTYGLVLLSMNYVDSVSYVAAVRLLSIPLGATGGILFLGEPLYRTKLAGLVSIGCGLVLTSFF